MLTEEQEAQAPGGEMKTVRVPMEWLNEARRTHYSCEDYWDSCPKSGDGYFDDRQRDECNCGADKWNAEIDALLAAAQQEDQRESNSNPSPSAGQSKQGLTSSHDGAPTQSEAERLAELLDKVAALLIKKQPIAAGYEVHKIAAAIRAKDKQP